jgi:hypothetical protein
MRALWAPACMNGGRRLVRVDYYGGAACWVDSRCEEAFKALAQVMRHYGYACGPLDTGAYNCRAITGGTDYSLHAYGIAGDHNWLDNPYGSRLVTDMPAAMVAAIHAIKTKAGLAVFRWGGDWDWNPATGHTAYDAMHYEVNLSPAELAVGIDWSTAAGTIPPPPPPIPEDDMTEDDIERIGDLMASKLAPVLIEFAKSQQAQTDRLVVASRLNRWGTNLAAVALDELREGLTDKERADLADKRAYYEQQYAAAEAALAKLEAA